MMPIGGRARVHARAHTDGRMCAHARPVLVRASHASHAQCAFIFQQIRNVQRAHSARSFTEWDLTRDVAHTRARAHSTICARACVRALMTRLYRGIFGWPQSRAMSRRENPPASVEECGGCRNNKHSQKNKHSRKLSNLVRRRRAHRRHKRTFAFSI